MSDRTPDFEAFLKDVERANDYPVIIWKFGFKKVEINGKIFLTPNTKDEFLDMYSAHNRIDRSEVEKNIDKILDRTCYGGGPTAQCYPNEGCTYCSAQYFGSGWFCQCVKAK